MSIQLEKPIIDLIQNEETLKIVSSVGKLGIVNSAIKQSLTINEDGNIEFLEFLESSDTNRNLIYSLWFEKSISILLYAKDGSSYELRGIPTEAIIEGNKFEQQYKRVQERHNGKLDLATIWVIQVTEVRKKNPYERSLEEQKEYPIIGHLDKYAKDVN